MRATPSPTGCDDEPPVSAELGMIELPVVSREHPERLPRHGPESGHPVVPGSHDELPVTAERNGRDGACLVRYRRELTAVGKGCESRTE